MKFSILFKSSGLAALAIAIAVPMIPSAAAAQERPQRGEWRGGNDRAAEPRAERQQRRTERQAERQQRRVERHTPPPSQAAPAPRVPAQAAPPAQARAQAQPAQARPGRWSDRAAGRGDDNRRSGEAGSWRGRPDRGGTVGVTPGNDRPENRGGDQVVGRDRNWNGDRNGGRGDWNRDRDGRDDNNRDWNRDGRGGDWAGRDRDRDGRDWNGRDRDRNWNGRDRDYRDDNRNRDYRDRDRNGSYRDGYRDARRDYRRWDRHDWRRDRRYNWDHHRRYNRNVYHLGSYYSPYRNYSYRRLSIGFTLDSLFFGSRYWINDPWQYRLPAVYGPYRWVRYYDDVLLVDTYTGEVVDVIHDFFW